MTHVVILGGGPAGLGAAYRLRKLERARVTLLERGPHFGGNAGTVDWNGHRLDFGSHRLHPSCDAEVMADIRAFLGEDLLDRPRHGRIRMLGRWVHFPLKPVDLLLHLKPTFALGATWDAAKKALPKKRVDGPENFATVLEASLGPRICRHFYFPYARKIWGHDPSALSAIQARRRVSASSFLKLFKKVLGSVPGLKKKGAGRFFYPRRGFGQISDAYAEAATREGAELHLGHTVTGISAGDGPSHWQVTASHDGETRTFDADHVWSTIPSTVLGRVLEPRAPTEVLEATGGIEYRAMILIYLDLPFEQFTPFDAHYFPSEDVRITRLSEPKNYAVRTEPKGRTMLCAELPCDVGDATWNLSDEALGELMCADLERSGLPLPASPVAVHAERLPQAYPVYRTGYEHPFGKLDAWLSDVPRLLTYGRQGLFAHDNTHHALYMAYCAAACLATDGTFDDARWAQFREEFSRHVVED